MHKLTKATLIFAVSMIAVGANSVYKQAQIDFQVNQRKPVNVDSSALSLPKGEVAAGSQGSLERPNDGTVGGVILLTGAPMPGAVRLTWQLSSVPTTNGIKLARSSSSFPSILNDENVEAPAGSASFLWKTPPGVWNFRLCLPDTAESGRDCVFYSNNVSVVVPPITGKYTPEDIPEPDKEMVREWSEGVVALKLTVTNRADGIMLSWTGLEKPTGFKNFRIVRSESNPQPSYPNDGFIVQIGDISFSHYIDSSAEPGITYYYRVCAENIDRTVTCGNTAVGKR